MAYLKLMIAAMSDRKLFKISAQDILAGQTEQF